MIPCPKCGGTTRQKGVRYTYKAQNPIVQRWHACKDCDYGFRTDAHVVEKTDTRESVKLAKQLKEALRDREMPYITLAERMNVSERTVRSWVNAIPPQRIQEIRNFLVNGQAFTRKNR